LKLLLYSENGRNQRMVEICIEAWIMNAELD